VARLRSAYGRHVGDPDWEEDIRRLISLSREFAELWARHEVADPEPRTLTYLHPIAGPLRLVLSELNLPDLPEAHIAVYTPADDDTRARMPLTRRATASAQVAGLPGEGWSPAIALRGNAVHLATVGRDRRFRRRQGA